MKDFFDLWVLAKHSDFDGAVLTRAVAATFERRQTAIPQGLPIGLSDEFINDAQKEKQWQAFLRKNALDPMPLAVVIADLREFLMPVLSSISAGVSYDRTWRIEAGWQGGFKNQPQQLMFGGGFSEFHIEQQLAVNRYR